MDGTKAPFLQLGKYGAFRTSAARSGPFALKYNGRVRRVGVRFYVCGEERPSKRTGHLLPQRPPCEQSQRQIIGCNRKEPLCCSWLRNGGTSATILGTRTSLVPEIGSSRCPRVRPADVTWNLVVSFWSLAKPGHCILETKFVSTEELTM